MIKSNLKTFSGFITLICIMVVILSIEQRISFAQGIEPQEVIVAYKELSLANLGIVVRLDWRPDGQTFAISTGNDLRIYTKDLIEVAHWQGHTDTITSVDWKPEGTRIATSSFDGTVRVWDAVETSPTYGATIYTLTHTREVYSVSWSPLAADNRLASVELVSIEKTSESARTLSVVHIWNLDTQSIALTLPSSEMERDIINLIWNSTGQYLAYSSFQFSRGNGISVYNASTGELLTDDFRGPSLARINEIAWQPNGNVIAYVDDLNSVNTVKFTPPGSITYLNQFRASPEAQSYTVAWNNDGTELAMGGTDRQINVWDPIANEARVFSALHTDAVTQVEWSPDGDQIAALSYDDVIRIWCIPPISNADTDQMGYEN